MKVWFAISMVVAAALSAPTEEISPSIVGGIDANPGEFPFIVSVQFSLFPGIYQHICGGNETYARGLK